MTVSETAKFTPKGIPSRNGEEHIPGLKSVFQ
jgi:hypothetical protein